MWSKLGIRVLSAVVGSIIVLLLIFAPVWVFNLAISVACLLALYELYMSFKQETKWQIVLLDYIAAIAIMLTPFISFQGYQKGIFTFILVAYLMLLLICSIVWNDRIKFYDVGTSFFMLIYAVLFLYHLTFIRQMENGVILIFLPLLGAWMPDTFAYFTGKLCGRHKLIPSVSPNKTVEGSIGAVVGCVLMFVVYGLVIQFWVGGYTVSYPRLLLLALLCGVFAQFGDLAASVIKRECHTKDFGNLIPGHGGILDRADSLIFVAPVVYYFLLFVPVIY